jgi:formate hydrogenlyase subunit 3/multisubunit Na+/H+ antiporter MnhD subunit
MNALSIIIVCMGVVISVGSFLYMMRALYGMWCIIPPEWENILCNKNESLLIKILIILYIIQWILVIPVIIYSLNRISEEPGGIFNFPADVCIINFLYLSLLLCGHMIFSHIYEKGKRDDE